MANILKTRILQKYDSYSAWNSSAIELKKGEIAFAAVDNLTTDANGKIVNVPTIVMKVGNGATGDAAKFANLPYVSALAADVYSWAKQDAATFIANFLAMNNGSVESPVTMQSVLDGVFATDAELAAAVQGLQGELTAALENYYTKTEIDAITGDLSTLNTTAKGNLVAAINEALQAVEVGGTGSVVTVTKQATATEGSAVTYVVTQGGDAVGDKIEIPEMIDAYTKAEADDLLAGKVGTEAYAADKATFATKSEVETALNAKADSTKVAEDIAAAVAPLATTQALNDLAGTHAADKQALEDAIAGVKATADAAAVQTEVEAALAGKVDTTTYAADKATFAVAETVNAALAEKADKATTYTKEEADAAFATPAEVISEVNKALAEVSDADSITNITTLVEYVNENAGDLTALITEVYGTAEMTGDSRIDLAEDNAAQAVSTANTAAADAAQAKSDAAAAVATANKAKTAATDAQTGAAASAAAAKADAEAAAQSKADAEAAKSAAEAAQTAAEGAQTAAAVSESNAAGSATAAGASAGEAAESAAAALADKGAAETAKTAAETAQGKAEEAQGAAENAQTAAETAQGKAEDAQVAAESARDAAVAAKEAAEASNTSATAIANTAKAEAEAATAASNAATEAVAGLSNIAKTGNVNDLVQTDGDVLIFDCGDATHVI